LTTQKTIALNEQALAIIDKIPGKSYSDKIARLYDLTENYLDLGFRKAFAELQVQYPIMKPVLSEMEWLLCESFTWLADMNEQDMEVERLKLVRLLKKASEVLENRIIVRK